jgi:hypothetical protein
MCKVEVESQRGNGDRREPTHRKTIRWAWCNHFAGRGAAISANQVELKDQKVFLILESDWYFL